MTEGDRQKTPDAFFLYTSAKVFSSWKFPVRFLIRFIQTVIQFIPGRQHHAIHLPFEADAQRYAMLSLGSYKHRHLKAVNNQAIEAKKIKWAGHVARM